MTPKRAKELGVTDDEYAVMLAAQGGGCAICGAPPKTRRLHVDHDHKTGRVRGLLCYADNRLLPTYASADRVDAAYRFLVRHELQESGRLRYAEEDRGYDSPCWIWQRAITHGYGVVRVRGTLLYLHRLMCRGVIPAGYTVDHLCRQRACCNPDHLEAVTGAENTRRGFRWQETCKRGHPWTPENTYLRPDGSGRRQCVACIRLRSSTESRG